MFSIFQRKAVVTLNIIITQIFSESFIEIPEVVQKICRFFSPILTTFNYLFVCLFVWLFSDISLLQKTNVVICNR